jgi:CheY-like chemotaxis protein
VSDTGCGIPEQHMGRIFEPYFTTKDNNKGTGLGLAVVHGIVNTHHGVITVRSRPGEGTRFDIFFPMVKAPAPEAPFAKGETCRGSGCILLVDDDRELTAVGRQMLEKLGYSVQTSGDGVSALTLFKEDPGYFDLVITDMTMPRMTGDRLATELLRIRPDLPIILCTGYSELINDRKAREIGIRQFLVKPVTLQHLGDSIRAALAGEPCPDTDPDGAASAACGPPSQ